MKDYVTANERMDRVEADIENSYFYRVCFSMIVVGLVGIIVAL